jgi:hypothetical protein
MLHEVGTRYSGQAMRSVADQLRRDDQEAMRQLSPAERVRVALALGARDLKAFHGSQPPGPGRAEARRILERRRQALRRASGCMVALIG